MGAYLVRRLLMLVPTLIGVTAIVFSLMHVSGDPIRLLFGPNVSEEKVLEKRAELGLDKPIYVQYWNWLSQVVQGNLGLSIHVQDRVGRLILDRIGPTLELTILALILTVAIAIPAGIISAMRPYTIIDNASRFIALFWVSMPYFWLGIMLMMVFGLRLRILPISGRGGPLWTLEGLKSATLPILTLGLPPIALFTRLTRSAMLEVVNEEYIRTARSKGVRETTVVVHHGLRNALLPVVTLLGLRLPWLFGGAVITETVFAWPGMGRLLVNAVMERDYPVVQGIVLVIALLTVLANLVVDFAYVLIDPRIRYG
ncbi:ABC transporter permease [Candidatus Bipolaricaulota bacterium]|nr:ABC transporter permease [Candidatus Bipolaricaulota bacterium]